MSGYLKSNHCAWEIVDYDKYYTMNIQKFKCLRTVFIYENKNIINAFNKLIFDVRFLFRKVSSLRILVNDFVLLSLVFSITFL